MSFLIPFQTLNYWILIHFIRAIARHVRTTDNHNILKNLMIVLMGSKVKFWKHGIMHGIEEDIQETL